MALILIESLGWGTYVDRHGNGLGDREVTLTGTVYEDEDGTNELELVVTRANGTIPGYIEEGTYDRTIDGRTVEVHAVAAGNAKLSTDPADTGSAIDAYTGLPLPVESGAEDVTFEPTGSIEATNVQAAIEEVATDSAQAAEDAAQALDDVQATALAQAFGARAGAPIPPWETPPPIGPELAVAANLRAGFNTTLPIPTLTANGSTQNNRTLINLGNLSNKDLAFRVRLNVVSIPTNGWASIKLRPVDASGNILAGAVEQMLITNVSPYFALGVREFDFKVGAWGAGTAYLEIRLDVFNNSSAGALQVSGLSVKEIAAPQRPMRFNQFNGTDGSLPSSGSVQVWQTLYDPVARAWRLAETQLGTDGALTAGLVNVNGYNTDRPFRFDPADPDFLAATASVSTDPVNKNEILLAAGQVVRSLRVANNDQILNVQKAAGTYELRGNTHNGETLRSNASPNLVYEYDNGDGTWVPWTGDQVNVTRTCRKFRFTFKTKLTRSAPDSDDFANVDHVATFFPDGMMRMDRVTTFLKAMRVGMFFEWMSSHDTTIGAVGRIGGGTLVLDEVDAFVRLAVPAAPTAAANNAAGSLPAATYMYAITRLTEAGETTPSPTVTQAVTGGTSTVTLTLPASVTGQTGWRVYGRANDSSRLVLLATLPVTATTWADDYSVPAFGQPAPRVNTARRLDTATTDFDAAISDKATWAVWYDPILNMCFGNIYDRDSVLDREGVAGVKVRLERGNAIRKNYQTVHWEGDGSPVLPDGESRLVASGEVWTATHWAFAYVPADPVEYHREIAVRAANLDALADIYPAT